MLPLETHPRLRMKAEQYSDSTFLFPNLRWPPLLTLSIASDQFTIGTRRGNFRRADEDDSIKPPENVAMCPVLTKFFLTNRCTEDPTQSQVARAYKSRSPSTCCCSTYSIGTNT